MAERTIAASPPPPAISDVAGTSDGACGDVVLRVMAILALCRERSRRALAVALSPSLRAEGSQEHHRSLPVTDDPVHALKRHLAQQLVERLEGWSQTDAAGLIGTDQPRVSDLRRGRLDRFSLEQLVRFLGRVGGSIELKVSWSSRDSFLYALPKQR